LYAQDGNGCIGSNTYLLTQPTVVVLTAVPVAITCKGANDGGVTCSVSGGTAGYTYSIDGVTYQASNSFSGLAPGSVTVYAKDANGCIDTYATTVIEPSQVTASGVSTTANPNDGTITITGGGGNMPYTYSINGSTYQSGSLFTGLTGGSYTIYVKDNNGCIGTSTVYINTVGLEELEVSNLTLVNLYPNPTNGAFTIEVKGVVGAKIDVKVFNMEGQLISQIELPASNGVVEHSVELSKKIAAGQYYVGIYDGVQTPVITKIVKN